MVPREEKFYCTLCCINSNSEKTYEQHLKGKKHMKIAGSSPSPQTPSLPTGIHFCQTCQVLVSGHQNFQIHLMGEQHKKKSLKPDSVIPANNQPQTAGRKITCDLCGIYCDTVEQLEFHCNGAKHKKKLLNSQPGNILDESTETCAKETSSQALNESNEKQASTSDELDLSASGDSPSRKRPHIVSVSKSCNKMSKSSVTIPVGALSPNNDFDIAITDFNREMRLANSGFVELFTMALFVDDKIDEINNDLSKRFFICHHCQARLPHMDDILPHFNECTKSIVAKYKAQKAKPAESTPLMSVVHDFSSIIPSDFEHMLTWEGRAQEEEIQEEIPVQSASPVMSARAVCQKAEADGILQAFPREREHIDDVVTYAYLCRICSVFISTELDCMRHLSTATHLQKSTTKN